ncbi:hypothetical protein AB0M02_00265 [Actinoplanes sp. NPDC051861]|uniref:hypothetical protein n=1 Tax=Actinoplanes sp. NPDC051861 TaxID=3155170 RepID=UPI003417291C
MSRGSRAGIAPARAPHRGIKVHRWKKSPTPGVCLECPLPRGNAVHDEDAIAAAEAERDARQAEHQLRTGDR